MAPVSKVQAYSDSYSAYRITFVDADDNEIDAYHTSGNWARSGPVYKVAANEQLIGVYGVLTSSHDYFRAFGFIVRAP